MILITGGTGKVGEAVVESLRKSGAGFRIAVRSPEKVAPGAAVAFDFDDPSTFPRALDGIETLFLLTPAGTAREVPVVHAARRAGVRHIVKLSVWDAEGESFAFARAHRAVERVIEDSGLGWTFLRPNGFMQNFSTAIAESIRAGSAFYFPSDFRHSIIDVRDLGAVAARALTDPEAHHERAYRLSGPESLSNSEIAAKLSAALGRTVSFVRIPAADFKAALLAAGVPEPYADNYLDLIRYYETGSGERITPDVQAVIGRPPGDFDHFARDHAAVWK